MRASEDRVQGISFFGGFQIHTGNRFGDGMGGSGSSPPDGSVGIWFSNTLSYDAETSTATWEQVNRETSEVVLSIARAVTGVFGDEMVNSRSSAPSLRRSIIEFGVFGRSNALPDYDVRQHQASGTSKVTPAAPLLVLTAPEAALGGDTVEVPARAPARPNRLTVA